MALPASNASWNHFSGNHRSEYFVSPSAWFDLTGCTSDTPCITTGIFVDPDGEDGNAGTSWAQAFKTIDRALMSVDSLQTVLCDIYMAPGTYSASTTGEPYPLPVVSNANLIGAGPDLTHLDGENLYQLFIGYNNTIFAMEGIHLVNGLADSPQ